jgi:hypothetical protein
MDWRCGSNSVCFEASNPEFKPQAHQKKKKKSFSKKEKKQNYKYLKRTII